MPEPWDHHYPDDWPAPKPDRTLDDIKTDRLEQDAVDSDIELLVGWIDQHIYANQMDAEQRVRTAQTIAALNDQHEQDTVFGEHLWTRIMRQLDLIEERDAEIERLTRNLSDVDATLVDTTNALLERDRALDFLRRSAQAAIDDPHSQNALWAEPVVAKIDAVLGDE